MKSELLNTQKSVQAINHKQIEIEGKINQFGSMSQRYKGKYIHARVTQLLVYRLFKSIPHFDLNHATIITYIMHM